MREKLHNGYYVIFEPFVLNQKILKVANNNSVISLDIPLKEIINYFEKEKNKDIKEVTLVGSFNFSNSYKQPLESLGYNVNFTTSLT